MRRFIIWSIFIFVGLAALKAWLAPGPERSASDSAGPVPEFGQPPLPAGCEWQNFAQIAKVRVIVVSPACTKSVDNMKAVGQSLRRAYSSLDDIVLAPVYDSDKAARLYLDHYHDVSMPARVDRYLARHHIAHYNKNANTGLDRFQIMPHGLNGEQIVFDYANHTVSHYK